MNGPGKPAKPPRPHCASASGGSPSLDAAAIGSLGKQPATVPAKLYDSLRPDDPVIRHGWLFADHWVQESADEIEEEDFDYREARRADRQAAPRSDDRDMDRARFRGC